MSARKIFGYEKGIAEEEWHGVVELCFPSLKVPLSTPHVFRFDPACHLVIMLCNRSF